MKTNPGNTKTKNTEGFLTFSGWVGGWLAGWLADWLAGWLGGWLAVVTRQTRPPPPGWDGWGVY